MDQTSKDGIIVRGVISEYPKHAKHNIFAGVLMPPVGIVSVCTQIRDTPGIKSIHIIDENNYAGPRDLRDFADHKFLQRQEPAQMALFYGGMSSSILRMYSLAQEYKKQGVLTIAGGSHVDALPKEALGRGVDIVVHGEGENTLQEIINTVIRNNEVVVDKDALFNIKGISFLNNGDYVFTGKREPVKNLSAIKDPDLTLVKYTKKKWSAIPISWGRGCNYSCEFCVVNTQYGPYKSSSIETAMRQVIKYSDMGYEDFFFVDDNFAQRPAQTIELCKHIGDYKRQFKRKLNLTVQVRSEAALNDELIQAMDFAGVKMVCIGYESPINEELKAMHKGVTVEQLVSRSKKLSEHFYIHGMFIFGYPVFSDSAVKSDLTLEEKAKRYLKFFKDSGIDTIQVMNAVPLPGSKLREKLAKEKRLLPLEEVNWDKHNGLFLCYDPTPEGIDAYDLQHMPKLLMKRKYLGNFLSRKINYGNWMNWAYNASVGFPISFGIFYTKRFVHNFLQDKREKKILNYDAAKYNVAGQKRRPNIFSDSLSHAWKDIERRWRNLAIKTYAGSLVSGWMKDYSSGAYKKRLSAMFSRPQHS